MIDAAVVAAYLGAAVARGGRRLLDTMIDTGLDRLSTAVVRRLGRGPATDLAHNPDSPAVRAHVARQLESTARCDPGFARELAFLVAQLDRSGGRRLINNVRAQVNVQAFDGGYAHYGDYNEGDIYTNDYDPADELVAGLSGARTRLQRLSSGYRPRPRTHRSLWPWVSRGVATDDDAAEGDRTHRADRIGLRRVRCC